ncbi:GSCOCG00004931001-RA-CDS [Cotesia congregata]|uniref:Similar to RNASET2: Ribonuclease T2 (Sus scrofa) n=1 Tax=Cotesia congregata TaxID=51543 RepID=A0A8J2HNA7_COTCN|nr:GSCOCG00004931001-RA-CDS [Cotesia congregata]CAG5102178.1 Similar to RNASET2: Ribonuclease T2 (Sus scrofa) [Cotesia congregata]
MWFSILNTHNFNDESFWKHEWDAHGSCLSLVAALNNIEKYFGKSLEMYEELNINSKLDNKNFKPGSTDPLGNIVDYYDVRLIEKFGLLSLKTLKEKSGT